MSQRSRRGAKNDALEAVCFDDLQKSVRMLRIGMPELSRLSSIDRWSRQTQSILDRWEVGKWRRPDRHRGGSGTLERLFAFVIALASGNDNAE